MSNSGTISDAPPRPDHRYLRARELIEAPKKKVPKDLSSWTKKLVAQGRKGSIENESLRLAVRVHDRPAQRIPMEAFIFSGATHEEIAKVLELPLDAVVAFSDLFFDMATAFPSRLEKLDYIETLALAASDPEKPDYKQLSFEHDLKKAAFFLGPIYVKWQFSPDGVEDSDIASMLEVASTDMFVRGLAHRLNPIDSNAARSARECYTLLTKAAGTLKAVRKGDDVTAVDALLMILKTGPSDRAENLSSPEGLTTDNINEEG